MGYSLLDFESWRPLFKHNFDALSVYQKASEELVRKEHSDWNQTQVREEAEKEWNSAARQFFESTLETSKKLQ